jgi:hypothetical protein
VLGVYQLKRLWSRTMAARQGRFPPTTMHDRHLDNLVVHAIGVGLEQTAAYLGQAAPDFEAFERWIVATTGGIDPERVARINAAVIGADTPPESRGALAALEASDPVLIAADLAFWDEHGYVVLHDAVPLCARRLRRRFGSTSAPVRTIRKAGIAATTTASWCNTPSTAPLRPFAAPAHPQGFRTGVGHRRSMGDHRRCRLQSARARGFYGSRDRICIGMSA